MTVSLLLFLLWLSHSFYLCDYWSTGIIGEGYCHLLVVISQMLPLFTVYCSVAVFEMPFLITNCQIMQAYPLDLLIGL